MTQSASSQVNLEGWVDYLDLLPNRVRQNVMEGLAGGQSVGRPVRLFSREHLRQRLQKKINVDLVSGCWNWTGYIMKNGYATIGVHHAKILIHRLSWVLFVGSIPLGLCVLHHCDNRKCCNWEHLFTGTNQENQDDCRQKGRHRWLRGELHPKRILTELEVIAIKQRHASTGESFTSISLDYPSVHKDTIRAILNNKSWGWLNP
jgi:hypothetical protein